MIVKTNYGTSVWACWRRGKDAKDVADMLGISQSYISRLEKNYKKITKRI